MKLQYFGCLYFEDTVFIIEDQDNSGFFRFIEILDFLLLKNLQKMHPKK